MFRLLVNFSLEYLSIVFHPLLGAERPHFFGAFLLFILSERTWVLPHVARVDALTSCRAISPTTVVRG